MRFSSDQTWRIVVAGEDAWKMRGVDDGGRPWCVLLGLESEGSVAGAAQACARACRTTGRSIIRPSSWAAPGEAASAASTRRAQSTASALGLQRGVDRRDLARVDAQLGAEAVAARPRRGRRAGAASSSSCGVTPATGAARPATRDAIAIGWRRRRGRPGCPRCPGRGRARSRACRRRGAHAVGGGDRCRRSRTPRALSISARTLRLRHGGPNALASWAADSALGSITLLDAGVAKQSQVIGEPLGLGVVDAHDDARAVRGRRPWPTSCAIASRASALSSAATASSRSSTTASAPLAERLGEALGPVARHEQIGARRVAVEIGASQMASAARSADAGRVDSRARAGSRRCARRAPAPGPCAGRRPRCRAAASRARARPASRPRASVRAPSAADAPRPPASC